MYVCCFAREKHDLGGSEEGGVREVNVQCLIDGDALMRPACVVGSMSSLAH